MINPEFNDIDPSAKAGFNVEPKLTKDIDSAEALEKAQKEQIRIGWLLLPETQIVFEEIRQARNSLLLHVEDNAYKWSAQDILVALEKARSYRVLVDSLNNRVPLSAKVPSK